MSTIQFPIEVIAQIIDSVVDGTKFDSEDPDLYPDRDEPHPLTAASLVSRTWSTICRSHIFRIIIISTENIDDRLRFLNFEAPHLGELIRIVRVWWDGDPDTTPAWYPECFGRLKNLRVLHLDHGISDLLLAPGPLATGITSMLAAPRLRTLVLRGWDFCEDGSDFLSMLPATLEELLLESITPRAAPVGAKTKNPRLEALRSLELQEINHPMFRLKGLIECPNLERLSAQWRSVRPWDLPPWIPSSLSELVLCAASHCNIPDFGTAIQPSVVEIYQSGDTSYLEVFAWIQDCVGRLPFPKSIQTLTLNIAHDDDEDRPEGISLSPSPSECEGISDFLLQLYEGGSLTRITLNITVTVTFNDSQWVVDEEKELANLKTGFAPLLKENVLDIDFLVSDWDGEIIVHCSVQRIQTE